MSGVFEGIRVVDFTQGMAALTGMVLADNGAEVVKVEPPDGDWARSQPGFLMWNRGKKSVVLDLDDDGDRASAAALAVGADVVIEHFRSGEAARQGLTYERFQAANPAVILCSISGYGPAATEEAVRPHEGVVSARVGLMCVSRDARPVFQSAPVNVYAAAMLAVEGIAAALAARHRTGVGQQVSTSLVDGASAETMGLSFERRDGRVAVPSPKAASAASLVQRGIRLCFLTPECADGRYIQMCCRQEKHFRNWLVAVGLESTLADDRFAGAPLGLRTEEDLLELERLLRDAMRQRTQAEWMRVFIEDTDVGADPFLTADEFLCHPQMVENERIVVLDDPVHGPVTQIGPLALFTATPSTIRASAPALGEHQHLVPAPVGAPGPAPARDSTPHGSPAVGPAPFAGKTVLEVAYFLAAPLGPALAAELGARVIKVEAAGGDPFLVSGKQFVTIRAGKESVVLDLKSDGGRRVLHDLIRRADALVHNFRPGTPERLGFGYDEARSLNPALVYLYAASFGSKGPERHRPAFHSTPHALAGGGILQAGEGNPPVDASYPDPSAGVAVGAALAMGLLAQERSGVGQYIETTMLTASGYVHGNRLTRFEGMTPVPPVDHEQRGVHAFYRLYPCRSGWLFLAAVREPEWLRLCKALGRPEWVDDVRYAGPAARLAGDGELTAAIEEVLSTDDADVWAKVMEAADVPAATAGGRTWNDYIAETQLVVEDDHHVFGTYWHLPPKVRLSSSGERRGKVPTVGEHTRAVLEELGYDDATIDDLLSSGAATDAG